MLIGYNGNFSTVPKLSENLSLEESIQIIPSGYEDILEYKLDEFSNSLILRFINIEESNIDEIEITINSTLFNPSKNHCTIPKFLIEQLSRNININFNNYKDYIFNQNQILWLILQHRLEDFKQHNKIFSGLLTSDIKALKDFINYVPYNSYNAIQKELNTIVILSLYDYRTLTYKVIKNNSCIGTHLKTNNYFPVENILVKLLDILPIQYSSESMGSKSKFVINSDKDIYRSVGHSLDIKTNIAKSLFPCKSNIVARNKSHITFDSYRIKNFKATSVFIQDYIPDHITKTYKPKDKNYVEALCIVTPMIDNRYLYGEIDTSSRMVNIAVIVRESIVGEFEEVLIPMNKEIRVEGRETCIMVGRDIESNAVYIEGCRSIRLIDRLPIGNLGYEKLIFEVERLSGNSRIASNSGIKGVTICRESLGKILNCVSDSNSEDFSKIFQGIDLVPDFAFGMNSLKTKENGVMLGRAALSVKLGLYKPKHFSGLLNSLDEAEINKAASYIPRVLYRDYTGREYEVYIGMYYVSYTELCYLYKSYKPQTFSFEAGRWLYNQGDKGIYNTIWDCYVDKDRKSVVIELEKILLDSKDIFNDDLPIYTLQTISKSLNNKDLILRNRVNSKIESRLLSEEWNGRGFILDCRVIGRGYIRIPSYKVFNMFISEVEGGMYMYPQLLIILSKILNLVFSNRYRLLKKYETQRYNLIDNYYQEIRGMLYTEQDKGMRLVQTLSRPSVDGFAGKQVTDSLLPSNTCVIMDNYIWKRSVEKALGENFYKHDLVHGFYGIHVRNPALWSEQLKVVKIWNEDDLRIYLHHKHGINLDKYLPAKYNRDLIIFSNDVLESNQSDVDGDHSIVYTLSGEDIQIKLKNFVNDISIQSQKDWIKRYILGEREADEVLIDVKTREFKELEYRLYDIPLKAIQKTSKGLNQNFRGYLYKSLKSKLDIGISTNHAWIFSMLLECYLAYGIKHNWKYHIGDKVANVKQMRTINMKEIQEMSSYYVIALQDFVVRGVKHNESGSSNFECLFLNKIHLPENTVNVVRLLTHELKMPTSLVTKFIYIVTWCQELGFITACSSFLKLYNKGTLPSKEDLKILESLESFVQSNTYFGMLLKPLYDLRQRALDYKEEVKEYTIEIRKDLEKSIDFSDITSIL